VLGPPLGEGRVAHLIGFGAVEGGLRIAGADCDVVPEAGELGSEDAADHAGAEYRDPHGLLLSRASPEVRRC
jgi:hypothetical protein